MSTSKEEVGVNRRTKSKKMKRYSILFLMTLPGIIYLLINNYLPMLGIVIAFKNYNALDGFFGSEWVGLKNFEYLFKTKDALIITRNTLFYNALFIILNTIFALGLAIFLNEIKNKIAARFYQSVVILPHLISTVIVGFLVFALLSVENGFINRTVLPMMGMDPISWYSESKYWPYILTIVNMWKNIGYLSVVYLAAIIGIDKEYYEAADLDGASKWKQIRYITIPMIVPIITIMTLLAIGRIFYADFGLFYQVPLNAGAIQSTTDVIDTYVYRALLNTGDIGMSSAAGMYQSLVGFTLVLISNYIVRKRSKENALF
ncbi:sugar ABC transporter permease [Bacillus sp. SA1-12]|nr:ABC transporter permease subunit [Bacillus sp. SA1-12]KKI92440.1 sugar ABC transporter permease [Bacillus sp. SA1-12]